MATLQISSSYSFNINDTDPLGFDGNIDNSFTGEQVRFALPDAGASYFFGTGFGNFEGGSDADLTGTVTDVVRYDAGGDALFSVSGLSIDLATLAVITNIVSNPDYGLDLFGTLLPGSDSVVGADGLSDILRGFAGNDTIQGNAGDDLVYGNQNDDQLFAGIGADTLFGGQDRDLLDGSDGTDVLYGNFHDDTIFGGADSDTIFGGQGNDSIVAGDGDDLIFANRGDDTMTGGDGADTFQFNFAIAAGTNTITDFAAGVDSIIVNNTTGTDTSISYDAGNNQTVITTGISYDQGQYVPDPNVPGLINFESAGSAPNEIIIAGGDYTSLLGSSIILG